MKSFLSFLKNKGVIGAIFMVIFYQIIMMGAFIPGYSAIPKNIDEIKIAIVNEDEQYGKTIENQLKDSLPFKHILSGESLKDSKEQLNDRDIQLIIHIPNDFSSNLQNAELKPDINFYVNEANPAMITSVMNQVISNIDAELNKSFSVNYAKGVLINMNVPEKQATELANSMEDQLHTNIVTINKVPAGLNNQMAPMFLTLVSYVGAMIASMLLAKAYVHLKGSMGKWRTFFNMQAVSVLIALIAPIVGILIVNLIHGYGGEIFMKLWMHHALQLFVSLQFTFIFSLLLGDGGMLVNLPLLLLQTIACGAVMTREVMYGFYRAISYVSPMYYTVQSDFSILFGGGHIKGQVLTLALIGVIALVINALIVMFKRNNKLISAQV